jgi:hypothetical protein
MELRIPKPGENKMELLTEFANKEGIELIDYERFAHAYIYLSNKQVPKVMQFLKANGIEQVEEIRTGHWPVQPVEKVTAVMEYLKEKNLDFTISLSVKLPKRSINDFIDFQIMSGLDET